MQKEGFQKLDGWFIPGSKDKLQNEKKRTLILNGLCRDTKNGGPVHWIHENYQNRRKCFRQQHVDRYDCCLGIGVFQADSVNMTEDPNVRCN